MRTYWDWYNNVIPAGIAGIQITGMCTSLAIRSLWISAIPAEMTVFWLSWSSFIIRKVVVQGCSKVGVKYIV